jgi:hypothetical protein
MQGSVRWSRRPPHWAVPPWLLLPLGEDPLLRTCKSPGEHGEEKSEAHSCSELRTSVALLENIGRFLLAITENIAGSLLGLYENELTILRTNSQTPVSAHTH